jgi:hypothetical protein
MVGPLIPFSFESTTRLIEMINESNSMACRDVPICSVEAIDRDGVVPPLEICLRSDEETAQTARRAVRDHQYKRNMQVAKRMLPSMWEAFGVRVLDVVPRY